MTLITLLLSYSLSFGFDGSAQLNSNFKGDTMEQKVEEPPVEMDYISPEDDNL